MIRRSGEPDEVGGIDSLRVWHVGLTEAPGREWRHAFLDRVGATGLLHDVGLRLAGATVSLQLERARLRAAMEQLDRCIAGANAACGLAEEDDDSPAEAAPGSTVVLVVDDQSALVVTVAEMLALQGFSVLEATDPQEALRIVGSRHVDVLLTDVVMPVMNGPELARRVLAAHPGIKIVFMSAYAVEEVLAWGAPFLSKPFTYDVLAQAIRDAIDRTSPFNRSTTAAGGLFGH
jgi:CheY-like chemotaxis protein